MSGVANKGSFKKGHKRSPKAGRKLGSTNRTTREMKQTLLRSMSLAGRKIRMEQEGRKGGGATDYLLWLAFKEPASYAALIGKLIPRQVDAVIKTEGLGDKIREGRARARDSLLAAVPTLTLVDGAEVIEPARAADGAERLDAAAD